MSKQAGIGKVLGYFAAEEQRLLGQIGQLADEQRQLQLQLDHIRQLRAQLGDDVPVQAVSAPKAAPAGAAPGRKAKAAAATTPRKTRGRKKPTRKGRRKTSEPSASEVNSLSIVDAAIHFAKENGQSVVDAGQILDWFEAAGYETRNGTPNRNSIYVSLNRERHEGEKSGNVRVEHVERGKFRFPEVGRR